MNDVAIHSRAPIAYTLCLSSEIDECEMCPSKGKNKPNFAKSLRTSGTENI